jgi:hypothetical protein
VLETNMLHKTCDYYTKAYNETLAGNFILITNNKNTLWLAMPVAVEGSLYAARMAPWVGRTMT